MDTKTPNPANGQVFPHKTGRPAAGTRQGRVPCWFMSNPFAPGMVYDQLEKADFDYVAGLDFGHGESLVALYSRITGKVQLLNLDATHATKIPTYIRFDGNDRTFIGSRAKRAAGFIQHFKMSPAQWKETHCGDSYYALMLKFIRTLWEQAVSLCDELKDAPKDRVMIVVGCPASPVWTNETALMQYRDLVRAATKYRNVSILPESTAAIMSVIHSGDGLKEGQRLHLDRGLAVIDAGSSTLDFTYVVLGKQLITRSVRLGGSDLDKQMLKLVLELNGIPEDQIPPEQIDDIMVQLRVAKEQYYPDRAPLSLSIPIWGKNPDGSGNRELDSGLALKCTINEKFMTQALNRAAIVPGGVLDFEKRSWLDIAGDFIRNCRDLIPRSSSGQLLCDHVLVTGGTSFVTELMDLIEGAYGKDLPVPSKDPSSSVAKGLAHAKRLDIQGRETVEEYRKIVSAINERNYGAFLGELCLYMADTACEVSKEVCIQLSKTPGNKKVAAVMTAISTAAQNDPRLCGSDYEAKVQELFQKHFLAAYDELREEANAVSARMYGANLRDSLPRIPPLDSKELRAILTRLNLKSFVSNTLLDATVSSTVFSLVQYIALYAALVLVDLGQIWAGIISWAVSFLVGLRSVQEVIQKTVFKLPFVTFSNKKLLSFAQKMDDDDYRRKTIGKLAKNTVTDMQKALREKERLEAEGKRGLRDPRPMYREFSSCLSGQAEAILGKLLFLVFDEKPNTGEGGNR